MNKSELIEAIAYDTNLSKADAERALNSLIANILENVNVGNKVVISGLGSFEKVVRSARSGVNPATGERIQIAEKNAPKFKAAKAFKDFIA